MATPAQPKSQRSRFDRRSLGGVVIAGVICGALLLAVWLSSRNAPSATTGMTDRLPQPVISANQGCENFGQYWTDTSGAAIDPAPLERFTNCRIQEDGTWVAADRLYGTEPLDVATLSEEHLSELEETRAAVAEQVDRLEGVLPSTVLDAFDRLYSPETNAVVGNFNEGIAWGPFRTRYARIVNAFMLDPENAELAGLIGWTMGRKIDGYASFRRTCLDNPDVAMLHGACRGMEDNLSIRYAPLPWDLRDTDLIDAWFYETVVMPLQEEQE